MAGTHTHSDAETKVFHRFGPRSNLKNPLICPLLPYFFQGGGVKRCEMLARVSTLVAFDALWFQNEAHIEILKLHLERH